MVRWTEAQQEAIESRGQNLLVSAAAGSGKTAVLVERIINMVLSDKVDIDKLLIVTFTNAAAGEMRERILSALVKRLDSSEGESEEIRRQMSLLNKASITTVHSFCINVLRRNFHFIDLDPNFRIADTTEGKILIQESLEELLEFEYGEENPYFIDMVESFSEDKGDIKIEGLILRVYQFIQSQPYPLEWLEEKIEKFNISEEGLLDSLWIKTVLEEVEEELEESEKILSRAIKLAKEDDKLFGKYEKTMTEDMSKLSLIREIAKKGNFEDLQKALSSLEHARMPSVKKGEADEELKEKVKKLRDDYKDIVKKLKAGVLNKDIESYRSEIVEMYPVMEYIYKLVKRFTERYDEKKRDRGILDFNDLEHKTLELLEYGEVRDSLREKYEHIFVDEYQDSNIVQETIIEKICRENNRFLVGDVKQSIYRFRLADPTLFIKKYFDYNLEENTESKRIDLSKNFRSRKEIIDGVNFIFKQLMSERLGEIDYGEDSYLYSGADYEDIFDNGIELNIIDKKLKSEEGEEDSTEAQYEIEDMQTAEVEAHFIAEKIKALTAEKTFDAKLREYRNIEYRDIVVLLRTMKNWAGIYEEVFVKEGIPIYTDSTSGYFEAMEVKVFLNLLAIIDNRKQDIPLLSVMRSPVAEFELEELIAVRVYDKTDSYHMAVNKYIEEKDDELSDKLKQFMEKLDRWKSESRYYKLDEFIWKLLVETNYYNYVSAMANGSQRQANLRMLVDRANEFEKASINGLFNFIRFSDKLKDINGDMGTAKTIGENENVVRIMSIHKSKGLEFPVVICGAMGKQFNTADSKEELVLHKDLGIGTKYVNLGKRKYNSSLPELAIKKRLLVENLSEELRILYVAFTRAKDKLVLYGTLNGLEKSCEKWSGGTNVHTLLKAKSFLDWTCMALTNHPSGKKLLEKGGCSVYDKHSEADESVWKLNFLEKAEILNMKKQEEIQKDEKREFLLNYMGDRESQMQKETERRFSWIYPHMESTETPSKVSVTYLKNLKTGKETKMKIPELMEYPESLRAEEASTAAERGTLNHMVLELMPFDREWNRERVRDYVEKLVEDEALFEEDKELLDLDAIVKFFESELYIRILNSSKVRKEQPFVYVKREPKEMYIQGIVDCYFEEDNELVLIDYKTDRIDGEGEFLSRYREQIELYRESLESITKKTVKNSYIYSLYLSRAIEL